MEQKTKREENILDKIEISFHRRLSFKPFTIGILVLLLLIPKVMILSLIQERSVNANETIQEVTSRWSNKQVIAGPYLIIPYKNRIYNKEKEQFIESTANATFLPKELIVTGNVVPQKLYRSIYDVVVYQGNIKISGVFTEPNFEALNIDNSNVIWEQAEIQLLISDLRGINKEVRLNWSGEDLLFSPGLSGRWGNESGISLAMNNLSYNKMNHFKLDLDLKGSKSLSFTPVGEKTEVEIASSWNDPGFTGNFLPYHREINEDGFKANWRVLHFNRNFPQQWLNTNSKSYSLQMQQNSSFGVELVSMANHYQKNTRSAKYAILIIVITFIVFFMFEVFSKQRIHPFQYIMVGSAITLFYLLLLSITEHLGFNLAYLIAATSVVLLVVHWSRGLSCPLF